MKKFLVLSTMMLALAGAAWGQNIWVTVGTYTQNWPDGTSHVQVMSYNPSTVHRAGDLRTFVLQSVYSDGVASRYFEININCKLSQYTFAQYDMGTQPPTLTKASEWKAYIPNSPAPIVAAIVCK